MNFTQLEAFLTVVKEGSISKASRELHLTQPALSAQIASLESNLNIKLLDRSNKGVLLTEAGESLNYYSKRMMTLYKNLTDEVNAIKTRVHEEIVIGASKTIGGYALPCSIYIFKDIHPASNIRLKIANSEDILQYVLDKSVSFGLVEGPITHPDLVVSSLTKDELVLITPPTDTWKSITSITLDDLEKHPLIMREKGSGTRKTIEAALTSAGSNVNRLKVIMELDDFDAIKSSVEAGRGYSLISKLAVKKELYTGTLHCVRVEGLSLVHSYNIIYIAKQTKTVLEKQFLKFITSPKERGFC